MKEAPENNYYFCNFLKPGKLFSNNEFYIIYIYISSQNLQNSNKIPGVKGLLSDFT